MSPIFWIVLALFVVTDIVVIVILMRRFGAGLLGAAIPGVDTGKLLPSAHAMVGEYLRVNYSGDPAQLAAALGGLLPRLRDLLRSHGVEPRPEVLRALIQVSAARHRIATARQLREALATIG